MEGIKSIVMIIAMEGKLRRHVGLWVGEGVGRSGGPFNTRGYKTARD